MRTYDDESLICALNGVFLAGSNQKSFTTEKGFGDRRRDSQYVILGGWRYVDVVDSMVLHDGIPAWLSCW